jgi:hypothetical protein
MHGGIATVVRSFAPRSPYPLLIGARLLYLPEVMEEGSTSLVGASSRTAYQWPVGGLPVPIAVLPSIIISWEDPVTDVPLEDPVTRVPK